MIFKSQVSSFSGFEFALFKLRDGVDERQLLEQSLALEEHFLAGQPGLLSRFLLKGKDGLYADVVIADTQNRAEEICQQWMSNRFALEYLELLDHDSVDMSFWTRIG